MLNNPTDLHDNYAQNQFMLIKEDAFSESNFVHAIYHELDYTFYLNSIKLIHRSL